MVMWTSEQLQAIGYAERPQILLMAGAGSGKTTVLAERVVQRLTQPQGAATALKPEELLVLTFTDKAARQMRQKIEERLDQLIWTEGAQQGPETVRQWREIRERLALAQISTIHAFAWQILQRYQLELASLGTPLVITKARIISGFEQQALLDAATTQMLEKRYEAIGQQALLGEEGALQRAESSGQAGWEREELEAFAQLLEAQDNRLSDQGLKDDLQEHYGFLRSLADYREALEAAVEEVEADARFGLTSPTYRLIFSQTEAALARFLTAWPLLEHDPYYVDNWQKKKAKAQEYKDMEALIAFCHERGPEFLEIFERLRAVLGRAEDPLSMAERQELEALWNSLTALGERLMAEVVPPALRKLSASETKTALRDFYGREVAPFLNLITGVFSTGAFGTDYALGEFPGFYTFSLADFSQLLEEAAQYSRSYAQLLLDLDVHYRELKREHNLVDFSDLEHLALLLLRQPEIQAHVAASYRDIYIDEYQDTSPLQDELLDQLSGAGQTRFMVGDVKQSIYRFRHAEPALFMARAALFAQAPERGETLLLSSNFRTQAHVLDYINALFLRLMTPESSGISYADRQRLAAGRPAGAERPIQFKLLCHPKPQPAESRAEGGAGARAGDSDRVTAETGPQRAGQEGREPLRSERSGPYAESLDRVLEARRDSDWTALQTLAEILRYRQAGYAYQDIMVLCRTNQQIEKIAEILQLFDIPIAATRRFRIDSHQLLLLTHLLEILDNPRQDIPLLAYLRSALHGEIITEEDLLAVAKADTTSLSLPLQNDPEGLRGLYFHQKLQLYLAQGSAEGARERLQRAMARLEDWREALAIRPYPDVLDEIVGAPSYREYLALLDRQDGLDRLFDLSLFLDWVREAYAQGRPFHSVVAVIKEQRDALVELDVEEKPSRSGRVQLLTIHRAKGLEAPVVIMAALEGSLWARSSRSLLALSTAPGGGLVPADHEPYRFAAGPYPLKLASLGYQPESGQRLELPRERALRAAERREEMGEHYRLLYVALTRAREAISLIAQLRQDKVYEQASAALSLVEDGALGSRLAKSYLELLLADLLAEDPSLAGALQAAESTELSVQRFQPRAQLELELTAEESLLSELEAALAWRERERPEFLTEEATPRADAEIAASLAMAELSLRPMPRRELLALPGKLTVSDLSKAARGTLAQPLGEEERVEEAVIPRQMGLNIVPLASELETQDMSAAAYGSFLHRLFLYLDLELLALAAEEDDAVLWAALERHYARLTQQGLLEPQEGDLLQRPELKEQLLAFCRSELARELLAARQVERERPFTLALRAGDLAPGLAADEAEEIIAVQGMIDLFFIDQAGEITLVDYKSDRLPEERSSWPALMQERYGAQLYYYREALERILQRKVRRTLIWLIRAGEAVVLSPTSGGGLWDPRQSSTNGGLFLLS